MELFEWHRAGKGIWPDRRGGRQRGPDRTGFREWNTGGSGRGLRRAEDLPPICRMPGFYPSCYSAAISDARATRQAANLNSGILP